MSGINTVISLEMQIKHGELPPTSRRVEAGPHAELSPEHHRLLARLDSFQAPWLEEKLLQEGVFTSHEEYQEAFVELKKYVALAAITKRKLAMMSAPVDAVWHQFILFTKQYQEFCQEYLGFFMHHRPKTSFTPLEKMNKRTFTRAYKSVFGQPSSLWDMKTSCSACNNGCSSSGNCGTSTDD